MILLKYDRHGDIYDIQSDGDYNTLTKKLEFLSKELESKGIMRISSKINDNLTRMDEFASTKHGWECVLVITHSRAVVKV